MWTKAGNRTGNSDTFNGEGGVRGLYIDTDAFGCDVGWVTRGIQLLKMGIMR